MPITIDPTYVARAQKAWSQLTPAQQDQLNPLIEGAHSQAAQVAQTGTAPPEPAVSHVLSLAKSALTNDPQVVSRLDQDVVVDIGPDGAIWGTAKWEQLDPGWVEAFVVFLESLITGKHPFATNPQTVAIPDKVLIAMVGDWGTGNWDGGNPVPSGNVGRAVAALNADITIHLGDVYYAGTGDAEQDNLVSIWPRASLGSFALNSNHEMYPGARAYFQAISNQPFAQQKGCSYFSLENANWIIVALDSAYYSSEDELYANGMLFPAGFPNDQNRFLQDKAQAASLNNKKLIVLTHHNGLNDAGTATNALYGQVTNALVGTGLQPYWYYGHEHIAAVYKPTPDGVLCRCCGHGSLPWGQASDLANSASVVWYEKCPVCAGADRVFNGFAVLTLDGANLQEAFYREDGSLAWSTNSPAIPCPN